MEWLGGVYPVREALRARRRELRRLWLARGHGPTRQLLAGLAEQAGLTVEWVSPEVLDQRLPPGARGQGCALEAGPLPELDLKALLDRPAADGRRVVALDRVEDPRNLGAVARVAEATGSTALLLPGRHSAPLSPIASRASAGALEHLPVCRVPNLARALDSLREASFWVLGAEPEASEGLFDAPDRWFEGELALVFGSEERGIRPGVARRLDHRLRIPMSGRVASLNVASAAAVVLFEVVRRRREGGS